MEDGTPIAEAQASDDSAPEFSLSPTFAQLTPGGTQRFRSPFSPENGSSLHWVVDGPACTDGGRGTVSEGGLYMASISITHPRIIYLRVRSGGKRASATLLLVPVQAGAQPAD